MLDAETAWRHLRAVQIRGVFDEGKLAGLPPPVARYFRHALADEVPLSTATRLRMRGRFRMGLGERGRWLPFTADQVLAPGSGFVWRASIGWGPLAIRGHDAYYDGEGELRWKLLRLKTVMQDGGADISRSSRHRFMAEASMAPQALLDLPGIQWEVFGDDTFAATWAVDGEPATLRFHLNDDGSLRSVTMERWGDPMQEGTWAAHPFGAEVLEERTFGKLTIPYRMRAGWWYGTERWEQGVFFDARITAASPLPPPRL